MVYNSNNVMLYTGSFIFIGNEKGEKYAFILIGLSYILNFVGIFRYSTYHLISIAVMRIPVFLAGMLACMYGNELKIKNPKFFMLLFSSIAFIFSMIIPIRDIYVAKIGNKYEALWLVYEILVPGLCFCFSFVIKRMHLWAKRFLTVVGGVSLELYLVHVALLHIKDFYFGTEIGGYWLFVIVPAISILSALFYKMIGDKIKLWIERRG